MLRKIRFVAGIVLRGLAEWVDPDPAVPQVCSIPFPHRCGVDNPCNGWPRLPDQDEADGEPGIIVVGNPSGDTVPSLTPRGADMLRTREPRTTEQLAAEALSRLPARRR